MPNTRLDIAFFGGEPIFGQPLEIVRPRFPAVETFIDSFRTALLKGQVTNNGAAVVAFERKIADYLGVPTLVFCNGQTAMMAMLKAAGIEGGEVIVPALTYPATPHAVRWCGAMPVFADVLRDSMCLDPADVERKITPETAAILAVDPYGIACDYRALDEIAKRRGLKFLVDSAPAFGTRVDNQLVGGFGDAQMFSFHATKQFATMEGGCISSHDQVLMSRAAAIRAFGLVAGGDCDEPGLNGKMVEICALIGLEQLKDFDAAVAVRQHAARRMRQGLSSVKGVAVAKPPPNQEPAWLYLPIVIDERDFGINRDALALALAKENLHVRKYYSPPCHHLSVYRDQRSKSLPQSEAIAYNVIALPIYNDMTDAECDGIVGAIADIQRAAPRIKRAMDSTSQK